VPERRTREHPLDARAACEALDERLHRIGNPVEELGAFDRPHAPLQESGYFTHRGYLPFEPT
jgi:hypothetical protein